MFPYFDKDNKLFYDNAHYFTARELCEIFNIRNKNGGIPYIKAKKALENDMEIEPYYFRPDLKSDFNKITVYRLKDINIETLRSLIEDRRMYHG